MPAGELAAQGFTDCTDADGPVTVEVGYWSVMGGMFAAIIGWTTGRVTGRVNRHTPFTFGPS